MKRTIFGANVYCSSMMSHLPFDHSYILLTVVCVCCVQRFFVQFTNKRNGKIHFALHIKWLFSPYIYYAWPKCQYLWLSMVMWILYFLYEVSRHTSTYMIQPNYTTPPKNLLRLSRNSAAEKKRVEFEPTLNIKYEIRIIQSYIRVCLIAHFPPSYSVIAIHTFPSHIGNLIIIMYVSARFAAEISTTYRILQHTSIFWSFVRNTHLHRHVFPFTR